MKLKMWGLLLHHHHGGFTVLLSMRTDSSSTSHQLSFFLHSSGPPLSLHLISLMQTCFHLLSSASLSLLSSTLQRSEDGWILRPPRRWSHPCRAEHGRLVPGLCAWICATYTIFYFPEIVYLFISLFACCL